MYDLKLINIILASLNFLFIIFGTIGNICTVFLLMRKSIRKHSCMRYLATLCTFDFLCLYTWNFSTVYRDLFTGIRIEFQGSIICRLFSFYSYFILQCSSWVICWIGMDRIITLLSRSTTSRISRLAKNNKLVTFVIIIIFFSFNLIVIIKNAEPYAETSKNLTEFNNSTNFFNQTVLAFNSTRTYTCYAPEVFYAFWDKVHIFMYCIVPFSIILCENLLISYLTFKNAKKINSKHKSINPTINIQTVLSLSDSINDLASKTSLSDKFKQLFDKKQRTHRKRVNIHENESSLQMSVIQSNTSVRDKVLLNHVKRNKKMNSKRSQVANLLLFLTTSFFFTTLPSSMYYALRLNQDEYYSDPNIKYITIGVLSLLQYARHAGNFLIYLFTSSIIRAEIKQIYRNFKLQNE